MLLYWLWDIGYIQEKNQSLKTNVSNNIYSADISRMDLIVRWGRRCRLSGFLPVQSVYSDFYVIDDYWPDYKDEHIYDALDWYDHQDVTLGG